MVSDEIVESKDVRLAITLKTNQLKRENLHSLTYSQVLQTLKNYVWRNKHVHNIHVAINDVMKLDVSIVVAYLSQHAIEQGTRLNLEDIQKVLEGELND